MRKTYLLPVLLVAAGCSSPSSNAPAKTEGQPADASPRRGTADRPEGYSSGGGSRRGLGDEASSSDAPAVAHRDAPESSASIGHDPRENERRLDRRISVNFEDTAFDDAINFLRDAADLNIVVSGSAQEKIDNEKPKVRLRLKDVSLRNVIHHVLAAAGEDMLCEIRPDMLVITTKGNVKKETVLVAYDVADIIAKRPDSPAPELGLPQSSGGGGKGSGLTGGQLSFGDEKKANVGTGVDADKLVEIVRKFLSDEDSVEITPSGTMFVRTTSTGHAEIRGALNDMRK